MMPLTMAKAGDTVTIQKITGKDEVRLHLAELGFGNCTNTRACEAECPKNVSISNIARLNRDFIIAKLKD
jgi:succinate dehydrogenase/fumarate reductase-like Fe-S protein